MIIQLKTNPSEAALSGLFTYLAKEHVTYHFLAHLNLVITPKYNQDKGLEQFQFIEKTYLIDTPYQLASKIYRNKTAVSVKGVSVGEGLFNIMAGPCSVENEDQIFKTAEFLSKQGVQFLRGGAYKPRTSPYSFRGLETEGLKLLRKAADAYGMRVVTEILDLSLLDEVMEYADVLQVGSRNMHNFYLLNELGKINTPILLKRGFQAKVVEWLLAAEYILSGGNENIILCERGIRSFDPSSRNTLDLGVVPLIRELSHLPIIIDPSHGTGAAQRVIPASLAAAAIGADGILVEVHPEPAKALSDSEQAISFGQFSQLMNQINPVLHAIGKQSDIEEVILKTGSL